MESITEDIKNPPGPHRPSSNAQRYGNREKGFANTKKTYKQSHNFRQQPKTEPRFETKQSSKPEPKSETKQQTKPEPKPVEKSTPLEKRADRMEVKREPQIKTTIVKGQSKQVMDWSCCLKKENPTTPSSPVKTEENPVSTKKDDSRLKLSPQKPVTSHKPRARISETSPVIPESQENLEAALLKAARSPVEDHFSLVLLIGLIDM